MHVQPAARLKFEGAKGAGNEGAQILLRHQHLVLRRRPLRRHVAEQLRQRLQSVRRVVS